VIKSKKHVFCYQLKKNNKDELIPSTQKKDEFESKHDEFVEIISSEDQFNKEDVYLIQPD
jgi:hypothetical protein